MKLSPKKAAERAGVSAALIYQWCSERRLVHYRCGGTGRRGRILIEEADLDAFLATLKVEADGSRETDEPGARGPSAFTNLDTRRLHEAWRKQGVFDDRRGR